VRPFGRPAILTPPQPGTAAQPTLPPRNGHATSELASQRNDPTMYRPAALPLLLVTLSVGAWNARAAEPTWTTYRGNGQRTANTDGVAGPANPKVLWVHKAQEHFVAAPVPAGDKLIVSGLGPFNVPTFLALNTDPKAAQRVAWSSGVPYLKLPTVSSPAVADGKLVFGDGMHQTSGATLHCLRLDKAMPLWQLPVPGELVHLEGSPTVA